MARIMLDPTDQSEEDPHGDGKSVLRPREESPKQSLKWESVGDGWMHGGEGEATVILIDLSSQKVVGFCTRYHGRGMKQSSCLTRTI